MEITAESVADQVEQTIRNVRGIVREGDSSLSDVVKTTVYLDDMED